MLIKMYPINHEMPVRIIESSELNKDVEMWCRSPRPDLAKTEPKSTSYRLPTYACR